MFEVTELIREVGTVGIAFIIFLETGVPFGFFFPGDSLLFTAGLIASQEFLNIGLLAMLTFLGAVAGNMSSYAIGKVIGPRIFNKEDSFFFKKKYVEKTKEFYARHGKMTLIAGRFMPIIRTFAPLLAGVISMNYRSFVTYTVFGAIFWTWGLLFLGYYLGKFIPDVDKYLIPIILFIIFLSFVPSIREFINSRKNRDAAHPDPEASKDKTLDSKQ